MSYYRIVGVLCAHRGESHRRWSATGRPGFAARSTGYEAIMEHIMPIRIKHHDKTSISMQQADISTVTTDSILVL